MRKYTDKGDDMSYINPEMVRSPKSRLSGLNVLIDKGESHWSLAKVVWDKKDSLAIRWNGGSDEKGHSVGTPQSRGLPMWFILPHDHDFFNLIFGTQKPHVSNKKSLTYMMPEMVRSPKARLSEVTILMDKGENSWSFAEVIWDKKKCFAVRWNGSFNDSSHNIGTPQSRGLPMWFILPDDEDFRKILEYEPLAVNVTVKTLTLRQDGKFVEIPNDARAKKWIRERNKFLNISK